jgi:hypothetical protein
MIGDFQSRHPGSKLETRNQKLEIGEERTGANRKLEVRNWKRREKTEKPQVEKRNLRHPTSVRDKGVGRKRQIPRVRSG